MKIAIYQGPGTALDVAANLQTLSLQAERAARESARLLIAPEMILSGYNIGPQAIAERAEASDGPSAQAIADIARQHGIAILYGYPERADGHIYNAVQLIERDGKRLANYRKTHLYGDIDRDAFSPGTDETVLANLDGWRIGLLICYDVEFPENVRRLALAGADFVAVPTAVMSPYDFVASHMVPTRAVENQVFVAYANRCASENGLEYIGLSCVVGPDGKDLARAERDETLIFADLEHDLLDHWRRVYSYLADRNPALYGPLAEIEGDSK
ncbi:MAG: carbon-nitrogen hydrolase family protein [Gammaproteobacteria bacterium]|jgi:predicted amidohydrolase|nr:carbon-nitrogen hydrolase family protein [Gammaproteobacteria bacterium]